MELAKSCVHNLHDICIYLTYVMFCIFNIFFRNSVQIQQLLLSVQVRKYMGTYTCIDA